MRRNLYLSRILFMVLYFAFWAFNLLNPCYWFKRSVKYLLLWDSLSNLALNLSPIEHCCEHNSNFIKIVAIGFESMKTLPDPSLRSSLKTLVIGWLMAGRRHQNCSFYMFSRSLGGCRLGEAGVRRYSHTCVSPCLKCYVW